MDGTNKVATTAIAALTVVIDHFFSFVTSDPQKRNPEAPSITRSGIGEISQHFNTKDPAASSDGGNSTVDFRRQRRTNATHQSTTDPDARLYKKAGMQPAPFGYLGHVLLAHLSGLMVDTRVTPGG